MNFEVIRLEMVWSTSSVFDVAHLQYCTLVDVDKLQIQVDLQMY